MLVHFAEVKLSLFDMGSGGLCSARLQSFKQPTQDLREKMKFLAKFWYINVRLVVDTAGLRLLEV